MASSAATRGVAAAPTALQLDVTVMAGSAATRGTAAMASSVATRGTVAMASSALLALANAALQRFCFCFFLRQPQERNIKRKGGRAFETYSKISTLLVGRNVIPKRPPVPTQAPSGGSNTNALWLRQ
jgi:hypothetical protein